MNVAVVFILVGVFVGVTAFGLLTSDIELILQQFMAFPTITTFDSFQCICENPNPNPGPNDPLFGVQFCDLNPASDGFLGDNAKMVCEWEVHESVYGGALAEQYWLGEGCDAEYWGSTSNWPDGYSPDSLFNDHFSTDLSVYRILVTEGGEFDEDTLTPVRGRVSSDEASIGTATFAREPTGGDTSGAETTDGTERSSTESGDLTKVVTRATSEGTNQDDYPTLLKMLSVPTLLDSSGDLNELAKESVVALLNSADPDINYYWDEEHIILLTQYGSGGAFWNERTQLIIDEFQRHNSRTDSTLCPTT